LLQQSAPHLRHRNRRFLGRVLARSDRRALEGPLESRRRARRSRRCQYCVTLPGIAEVRDRWRSGTTIPLALVPALTCGTSLALVRGRRDRAGVRLVQRSVESLRASRSNRVDGLLARNAPLHEHESIASTEAAARRRSRLEASTQDHTAPATTSRSVPCVTSRSLSNRSNTRFARIRWKRTELSGIRRTAAISRLFSPA
jgi:hypothetical protein